MAITILWAVTTVVLFIVGFACGDLRRGTQERLKRQDLENEPDTLEKLAELRRELERGDYVYIGYPPTGKTLLMYHPGVLEPVAMTGARSLADLVGLDLLRAPMNFRDFSKADEDQG